MLKQDVEPIYHTIIYVGGHIVRETPNDKCKTYIYVNPCYSANDIVNNA